MIQTKTKTHQVTSGDRPHYRTKATIKHAEWKSDHKFMDIYRANNPEGKDLTYIKDGLDRKRKDNGTRLDKFVVTEDLT